MKIAIDASPAFLHLRTGIEEYSYQLIKHLRPFLKEHEVTLYIRGGTRENIDFVLPATWRVKELRSPKFWTYGRLSFEFLFHKYDRFFVPGHIVPPIRPKDTIMVVHGLEYEVSPESFSAAERRSMRFGIQRSCSWARHIICVSNNTKRDLMRYYDIPRKKIRVIYEGVNAPMVVEQSVASAVWQKFDVQLGHYLLFVGRVEHRKNIISILKAYEILREHFRLSYKLVIAGKSGHGWEEIEQVIASHTYRQDIVVTGFVSAQEKWVLLRGASVFVFPTLYEGFGLPVLEAQMVGVPVVTSYTSSLGEITQDGEVDSAVTVDPASPMQIAEGLQLLLSDQKLRTQMIAAGHTNTKRYSWKKAARLSAKVILAGRKSRSR